MPLLKVEAEKLSNNTLISGIVEEIIDRDNLYALLPFQRVNSKALVYNRENTLGDVDFYDPNDTISESAATFTEKVATLRIMASDVDIDKFLDETMGDTNNQTAIQLAAKAKQVSRKFQMQLANGDAVANAKAFDGLPNLVDPAMEFVADAGGDGSAITLEQLDQLRDMIINGADALVMRKGTWRSIRTLLRALGGTTPSSVEIPNFGVPVPAFDGTPVVINDFLAADETQGATSNTTSIYAVRMNEVDGLHGIYGGDQAGIRLEEVGTVQNKDAYRYRMKWYTSLVLKSTQSMARLKGVTNT